MGKSEGHAIEGIVYALCKVLLSKHHCYSVLHVHPDLPLTMQTDVLVFDNKALHADIMVCHSDNKDYAHRKIKRTRQEFVEALQLPEISDKNLILTKDYRVINFVFGMPNGWQDSQIEYMKTKLSPTVYLPEFLNQKTYDSFIEKSMSEYKKVKRNKSNWPEYIYKAIVEKRIILPGQRQICKLLEHAIFSTDMKNKSSLGIERLEEANSSRNVDLPLPFASRFRQGLSLLNVFTNNEIDALYYLIKKGSFLEKELDDIQRQSLTRAIWIGLITINTNITKTNFITPRKRQSVSQVDFSEPFESLSLSRIHVILDELNNYAEINPRPFLGGIQYLSIGNYSLISKNTIELTTALIDYLNRPNDKNYKRIIELFSKDEVLVPDTHDTLPAGIGFRVCRSVFAAFISVIIGNPKFGGKHACAFTSSECLPSNEVESGLKLLLANSEEAIKELVLMKKMCEVFNHKDVSKIINWQLREQRPKTFDIQIKGSWLQRLYFVISSHAAYNPLMSILFSKIVIPRYRNCELFGFPNKLAESLSVPFPGCGSPGKYRIIVKEDNKKVHVYEALSITENHLGDKSKELYDRIGAVRAWGRENDIEVFFHGLFDGDFSTSVMREFTDNGHYDEFISIRDCLREKITE